MIKADQLAWEMENDIDRYPIPISFDPQEEQKLFWLRKMRLQEIAKRFIRRQQYKASKIKT